MGVWDRQLQGTILLHVYLFMSIQFFEIRIILKKRSILEVLELITRSIRLTFLANKSYYFITVYVYCMISGKIYITRYID